MNQTNNIVITDSAKFQEVIDSFEESIKKITDIFSNQVKNVERINETDVWSGKCAQAIYSKYTKLNDNYAAIEYSLRVYLGFLKKTLEDYTLIEAEINKNMENVASSLDVNS